ncbi:30334_t:CDS:1, partial [Racocetra persica]
ETFDNPIPNEPSNKNNETFSLNQDINPLQITTSAPLYLLDSSLSDTASSSLSPS